MIDFGFWCVFVFAFGLDFCFSFKYIVESRS